MNNISQFDLGWITGIIEGEGTFSLIMSKDKKKNKEYGPYARVQVAMTDYDALVRLLDITGIGNIITKKTSDRSDGFVRKDQWSWTVTKSLDVRDLLNAIEPYLCERRKERAHELLNGMTITKWRESPKAKEWNHGERDCDY